MILGGDRLHRSLHEDRVEQTKAEADPEENTDHRVTEECGRQGHQTGEHDAHGEQSYRPESH
jgi:hypothetical protein